jgi:hypothetical protein
MLLSEALRIFAAQHKNPVIRDISKSVLHLFERLDMTDQTVADLKADYENFRDKMNTKVQALMDAQAKETLPPAVQQAINDLAAEMTGDAANAAAGSVAAVTTPTTPTPDEVPAVTGE